MKSLFLLLSMGVALCCHAQVAVQDLDHYLRQDVPEKLILQARHDISQAQIFQREIEAGWQVFGLASFGHAQDFVTKSTLRSYINKTAGIGVSHALLGTYDKQLHGIAAAQLDAQINKLRINQYQREQLRLLRLAWLNAWVAQEKLRLSKEILAYETQAQKRLLQRQQAGLLLESDRLEALGLFPLTRKTQVDAQRLQQESFLQIQHLSSVALPETFYRPELAQTAVSDGFADPLHSFQTAVRGGETIQSLSGVWQGVDGQLQLGVNVGKESWAPDQMTNTVYATVTVNFPAGIKNWRHSRSGELQARINEQQQLLAVELNRREQIGVALQGEIVRAQADVEFQAHRLAVAQALLREKTLRLERLTGSVYEEWLKAYSQMNMVLFDGLNAWQRLQTAQIELASLMGTRLVDASQTQTSQLAPDTGFYVWDIAPLLAAPQTHIAAFERAGVKRVLLSMTAQQLADPGCIEKLHDVVTQLHIKGIRVEWLLGEAGWIQSSQRSKLIALLHSMQSIPFDGFHLDFEVEQLHQWHTEPAAVEKAWLQAVVACVANSPWPVGVSIHPRHLDTLELMQALQSSGVREIALMSYVTQWQIQARMMAHAKEIFPQLRVALALSIEANQSAEISYHNQVESLKNDYLELVRQLNFAPPLLIQSWEDWERMIP